MTPSPSFANCDIELRHVEQHKTALDNVLKSLTEYGHSHETIIIEYGERTTQLTEELSDLKTRLEDNQVLVAESEMKVWGLETQLQNMTEERDTVKRSNEMLLEELTHTKSEVRAAIQENNRVVSKNLHQLDRMKRSHARELRNLQHIKDESLKHKVLFDGNVEVLACRIEELQDVRQKLTNEVAEKETMKQRYERRIKELEATVCEQKLQLGKTWTSAPFATGISTINVSAGHGGLQTLSNTSTTSQNFSKQLPDRVMPYTEPSALTTASTLPSSHLRRSSAASNLSLRVVLKNKDAVTQPRREYLLKLISDLEWTFPHCKRVNAETFQSMRERLNASMYFTVGLVLRDLRKMVEKCNDMKERHVRGSTKPINAWLDDKIKGLRALERDVVAGINTTQKRPSTTSGADSSTAKRSKISEEDKMHARQVFGCEPT